MNSLRAEGLKDLIYRVYMEILGDCEVSDGEDCEATSPVQTFAHDPMCSQGRAACAVLRSLDSASDMRMLCSYEVAGTPIRGSVNFKGWGTAYT